MAIAYDAMWSFRKILCDEKFIKTQWGYKAYFSSKSNSRGVALMFNNNFEFSVEKEIYDDSGNYVILDCTIEDHKFI